MVQVRQFALEQHVMMVVARDVARAACARTALVEHAVHGSQDLGVLPHAEVIVRAPYGDLVLFAIDVARSVRESATVTFDLGEHAIAPLVEHGAQLIGEKALEIRHQLSS